MTMAGPTVKSPLRWALGHDRVEVGEGDRHSYPERVRSGEAQSLGQARSREKHCSIEADVLW